MEKFSFQLPTQLIVGEKRYQEVGSLCAAWGKRVLLHYGGGSIKQSGLYDRVVEALKASGCEVIDCGGVQPNPRLELVREGIALAKAHQADMVLAVGGGSVIDSAKGIAAGACTDVDVWDFYMGQAVVDKALPIGVVLTLPAAGSESSAVSVVTKMDTHDKRSFHSAAVTPKFAILAPELYTTLPKSQIANATSDVISHVFERYFSDSNHVLLTDRLCEVTIQTAMQLGLWLMDHPDDVAAWGEFALTANVAHNGFLGQGRIEDWGTHGIGHELSSFYDMAHGASLAIATPAWMRYVAAKKPDRFVQFAQHIMNLRGMDEAQLIKEAILALEAFYHRLGLATTLTEAGLAEADLPAMAKSVCKKGPRGRFYVLSEADCLEIYKLAR